MKTCLCGKTDGEQLFVSGVFAIIQCAYCSLVRTDSPKRTERSHVYSKHDFAVYIQKEHMFRELFQSVIAFIKKYKRTGVMLEIGAGAGLLVDEARNAGFDAYGIEPSRYGVKVANQYFHTKLIGGKFTKKVWKRKTDIVVLNHVLEHVSNPNRLMSDVGGILRTNGLLVIGVPNFGSFLAKAKKDRWQSLIPDQHCWHFTKRTLDHFARSFGFRRIGITSESHDRSMHPSWKRPLYAILDTISHMTHNGEAILAVYSKA